MKKIILLLALGFTTILWANTFNSIMSDNKAQSKKNIKKIDKELSHKKAQKRKFKTQKEFKSMKNRHKKRMSKRSNRKSSRQSARYYDRNSHSRNVDTLKRSSRFGTYGNRDRYYDDDSCDIDDYRDYDRNRARAYRHSRNSWRMAYRYERASFYDMHGYYYGYFNSRGYMFEGVFYRYDRYYSYHDRIRGKGLFERRYYRPIRDSYYSNFNDHGNFAGFEFSFGR